MASFRDLVAAAHARAQSQAQITDRKTRREETILGLLATPDFFPAKIDWQRQAIVFAQMSRESFRRSTFLDERLVRGGSASFSAGLAELSPNFTTEQAKRPSHYILHGAFCGSTLMARHLEELPHCFVLKEPELLAQLARSESSRSEAAAFGSWMDWFELSLSLLARAYPSDTAVVTKVCDVCNWMGSRLLDHDDRTKIVFLSSPLKTFLLSVLKRDDRRRWCRGRVRQLHGHLVQIPFLTDISVEDLSDGQRAAVLWLLNSFLCNSLLARPDADRVRSLNSEELIRRPLDNLFDAADFFGLTDDEANQAALTALRPLSYHAKDLHLPYDAASRATDLDDAVVRFGGEVRAAISWTEQVASGWLPQSPFPVE
jgi:hypothetical protein